MSIIEYSEENPHAGGFVGLRVIVTKIGTENYQEYFSFKGKTAKEIRAIRKQAREVDKRETLDQSQRKASSLLVKPSRNDLSEVYGIMVIFAKRNRRNGQTRFSISINVTGDKETANNKSGTLRRFEKNIDAYDYDWFVKTWREACRIRARYLGLKRTPTRWLQLIASEEKVKLAIDRRAIGLK